MKLGAKFQAVCFDFDSTLTRLEGIDELAKRAGVESEIAPLTAAAMEGLISLDQVYGRRLDIVRPSRGDIEWLAQRYIDETTKGAAETVAALTRAGVCVYIVSGGLRPAILPFAARCGIAGDHVYGVDLAFNDSGHYANFDHASPLTRPDGKAVICTRLRHRHAQLALVGDGITDIAARDSGAFIIGFGGVVERKAVRQGADCFVAGPALTAVLPVVLGHEP